MGVKGYTDVSGRRRKVGSVPGLTRCQFQRPPSCGLFFSTMSLVFVYFHVSRFKGTAPGSLRRVLRRGFKPLWLKLSLFPTTRTLVWTSLRTTPMTWVLLTLFHFEPSYLRGLDFALRPLRKRIWWHSLSDFSLPVQEFRQCT